MKRTILSLLLFCSLIYLWGDRVVISESHFSDPLIKLNSASVDECEIELSLSEFYKETIKINNADFESIILPHEGLLLEKGKPQLPQIGRSIIIPNEARMEVSIIESEFTDYTMSIMPSKGSLFRDVNPDDIPFTFSEVYHKDEFFPGKLATLGDPYILRDYRGISISLTPFQYNPVKKILRVYHKLKIKVTAQGIDYRNSLSTQRNTISSDFQEIYDHHFLNFDHIFDRYTPILEEGSILVITHPSFSTAIQPYINWKRQKGIQTNLVTTTETGTTNTAIKTYIQNYFSAHPDLSFVQLVGDAAQIATLSYGGGGSDPSYVMLSGNDNYPDLLIGRFSAESVSDVETQVQRSIWYERDITISDATWLKKGTCIASNEGGGGSGDLGESDIAHQNLIRTDLLNYGYTSVDQAYAPSITATTLSNYFNEGRGIINYTGHGSNTTWVTSSFSNTHVNALTNDYKLPFIISVACVNGNFTGTTCFAEAWLRAKNPNTGAPTGAVATYMSTVNQPWNEPMRAQDLITDLMVANNKYTFGALVFNGSSGMLDAYSNNNNSALTMKTWTVFGDVSLQVRNKTPLVQTVISSDNILIGQNTYTVSTNIPFAKACLYDPLNNQIVATSVCNQSGSVTLNFSPFTQVQTLKLTLTAPNSVTFIKDVNIIPNQSAYVVINDVILTSNGDLSINTNASSFLNFQLDNIGTENLNNLSINLTSQSQYINVINGSYSISQLLMGNTATISNQISLQSVLNCPNNTNASMLITVSDNQGHQWTHSFTILLKAPVINIGEIFVSDTSGNNNLNPDTGESIILQVPVINSGLMSSPSTMAFIISNNPFINVQPNEFVLSSLNPGASYTLNIPAVISADCPTNSFSLVLMIDFTSFVFQQNIQYTMGQKIESFETANFSAFPWINSSAIPWTIDASTSIHGARSARSGAIGHSNSTQISVVNYSTLASVIRFKYKVSSESGYDYLKFYIDNTLTGSWSGSVDWSQAEYPVSAGNHTFKWVYSKDGSEISGSDCAWLDQIIFPGDSETNIQNAYAYIDQTPLEFGNQASQRIIKLYNLGNSSLSGQITVPNGFFINTANQTSLNYNISANSFQDFTLIFSPQSAQSYDGVAQITTNDSQHSLIQIQLNAGVDLHFSPVWSGTAYQPMIFTLPNETMQNLNLNFGDEIAIFDGSLCVGSLCYSNQRDLYSIITSRDHPDTPEIDGFIQDHTISIRIWQSVQQEEIQDALIQAILPNEQNSFIPDYSTDLDIVILSALTQNIGLSNGWNIVSFNVIPDNNEMNLILQQLINQGQLVKVQNESGQSIEYLSIINQWINNIGNMENSEAYYLKVNTNTSLTLTGAPVSVPYDVNLTAGWNYLPVPYQSSVPATTVVQTLMDNSQLIKMINESGQSIEYINGIGWINSINQLIPGEGYMLKVNQNLTLTFPLTYQTLNQEPLALSKEKTVNPSYYHKIWQNNGYKHCNIYLLNDAYLSDLLSPGDEIALFDGANCVAIACYDPNQNIFNLIASQTDQTQNVNGYIPGNNISIRAYQKNSQQELVLNGILLKGKSSFEPNESSVFQINNHLLYSSEIKPLSTQISSVYPNPFNPVTNIRYQLKNNDHVSLCIYNIKGQKIKTLRSENQNPGIYQITWDGKDDLNQDIASGIYFCILKTSHEQMSRKLILLK